MASTRWVISDSGLPKPGFASRSMPPTPRSTIARSIARAVDRVLHDVRPSGLLGGAEADAVDLDVVRMAVAAVVVVDGDEVGLLLGQDRGEAVGPPGRRRPARSTTAGRWSPRPSSRSRCSRGTRPARRRGPRPSRSTPRCGAGSAARRRRARPGTGSPSSPRVAKTRTTRWPADAARASVPATPIDSSSGWAWKLTIVAMAARYRSPRPTPPVVARSPVWGARGHSSGPKTPWSGAI